MGLFLLEIFLRDEDETLLFKSFFFHELDLNNNNIIDELVSSCTQQSFEVLPSIFLRILICLCLIYFLEKSLTIIKICKGYKPIILESFLPRVSCYDVC